MSKMLIDRAAVEQVLEALQNAGPVGVSGSRDAQFFGAIDALRAALEQEEQDQPDINWLRARPYIEQFIEGVGYDMTLTNERVRFEAREKVDVRQEQEELVARRSALAALNHLSLHNGPGRLQEATKMLVNPPRREWVSLTEEEIGDVFHAARNAKLGADQDNSRHRLSVVEIARAIEAALKERNHG
jgi:hypothetical protein